MFHCRTRRCRIRRVTLLTPGWGSQYRRDKQMPRRPLIPPCAGGRRGSKVTVSGDVEDFLFFVSWVVSEPSAGRLEALVPCVADPALGTNVQGFGLYRLRGPSRGIENKSIPHPRRSHLWISADNGVSSNDGSETTGHTVHILPGFLQTSPYLRKITGSFNEGDFQQRLVNSMLIGESRREKTLSGHSKDARGLGARYFC
jgi:hypothetical protein